jgi:hypothetical protein
VNPEVVGVAIGAMPIISPEYTAVWVGNPGEANGVLPKDGEPRGFANEFVGDMGCSFKFSGVRFLGNSHCVDWVGR